MDIQGDNINEPNVQSCATNDTCRQIQAQQTGLFQGTNKPAQFLRGLRLRNCGNNARQTTKHGYNRHIEGQPTRVSKLCLQLIFVGGNSFPYVMPICYLYIAFHVGTQCFKQSKMPPTLGEVAVED